MVGLIKLLAAAIMQSSALQSDTTTETVVGHVYKCEATLQLAGGKLTASRTLASDKNQMSESDTASWHPLNYEGWSASWSVAYGRENLKLSQIPASVRFFVRSEKRLPRVTLWTLRNSDAIGQDVLELPLTTNAAPKLGSAQLPLRVLLAYAGARDIIEWTVSDPKMSPDGTRPIYAQGKSNVGGLREAFASVTKMEVILGELAAAPDEKCKLIPVYYDPNSEI